jgi:methylglutaconyl-CoA hydratase
MTDVESGSAESMSTNLLCRLDSRGVLWLTLNRPDVLNAFDEALINELAVALQAATEDAQVRMVVLGATGRVFCAGADIAWMQRAASNSEGENLSDARRFAEMMRVLAECSKPVVARIQGAAYGGGVGLTCAADIAVASKRAKFCVSEARFGIIPAVIGPYLVNAVGPRQARRLALSMTMLSAEDALRLGMVHCIAEDEDLDTAVETVITELLAGGPQAQSEIKQLFGQLAEGPVSVEVRELTARTISRIRSTAEAREGFAAFVAKRQAAWVPSDSPEE